MTESIYKEYQNKYYNPNDNDKKPGDNDNWKSIQEGFHRIGSTQLETTEGLTLGKGTEEETSVTAAELEEIKNPTQLETSGGLTLGKGTADEVSVTAAELEEIKSGGYKPFILAYRTVDIPEIAAHSVAAIPLSITETDINKAGSYMSSSGLSWAVDVIQNGLDSVFAGKFSLEGMLLNTTKIFTGNNLSVTILIHNITDSAITARASALSVVVVFTPYVRTIPEV